MASRRPAQVLLIAVVSLADCHKSATPPADSAAPGGDAVKRSLDALASQLSQLEVRFSALRTQVEAVPPDLPGFRELRARFYAIEEGRGVTSVKVTLLENRLESALRSGNREATRQIANEIFQTYDELRQIEQLRVTLQNQVLSFQRMAPGRTQAAADSRR